MKQIGIIIGFLLLSIGNLRAIVQYNLYQQKKSSFDYNSLYNKHTQPNLSIQEQKQSIVTPQSQPQTISAETTTLVNNDANEEYSKCIKQATNLYSRYFSYYGSARHVSAFYNVIKNTKQNPTDENIADLKYCMTLINKFGNGSQSPDALEKKLKSTKDKDEQMKIFVEEAKQSNK